jgi:hypothetical protein
MLTQHLHAATASITNHFTKLTVVSIKETKELLGGSAACAFETYYS